MKNRQAREGRNPKTGELVAVHAKRVPFFKVGKELRLRVDGKPWTAADSEEAVGTAAWAAALGPWRMAYVGRAEAAAAASSAPRRAAIRA